MKKSKYTDEQNAFAVKQTENRHFARSAANVPTCWLIAKTARVDLDFTCEWYRVVQRVQNQLRQPAT